MGWIVGRDDPAIYVEEGDPLVIQGVKCGEQQFASELEALRYAVECEQIVFAAIRSNLRDLKARLRKAERKANP